MYYLSYPEQGFFIYNVVLKLDFMGVYEHNGHKSF